MTCNFLLENYKNLKMQNVKTGPDPMIQFTQIDLGLYCFQ